METIGPIKETTYEMPTKVIFGRGALAEVGDLPLVKKGKRLVLVVGGHFKARKDFSRLKLALAENGRKVAVYGGRILKSNFAANIVNLSIKFRLSLFPQPTVALKKKN